MKKKILSFILVLGLFVSSLMLFTACGGKDEKQAYAISYVDVNGNEQYGGQEFEYSADMNINPIKDIKVKIGYDDGSQEVCDFFDSKFTIKITWQSFDESVLPETLKSLPNSTEYKVGTYTIEHQFGKVASSWYFNVIQATYGGQYSLSLQTSGWDYISQPTTEELVSQAITSDAQGNVLEIDNSTGVYLYTITEENWNALKQQLNITSAGYTLPDTQEVQEGLEEIAESWFGESKLLPGEYIFVAKVVDTQNYKSMFTTQGHKITVEKTVLFVTEETKDNICRNYEFDYQTLEEVQQGIALELNRYNMSGTAPIEIQDEHGNEYSFDNFGPTDTWEEGTPEKINYFEHNGQDFKVLFAPANYVAWTNNESFAVEGFDLSNIFVKVGIYITPVKITADLKTKNFVYGEYQQNKADFSSCFALGVDNLNDNDVLATDLINFEIKKGEETLTTGANVGLNDEHAGYFYLNVADNNLDIGTYTVDLNRKYPKAIIIEYAGDVQQQSVVIEKADLKLTTESYEGETGNSGCDVTISETGNITAKYVIYYEGIDTFYKGYLSNIPNLSEFKYTELKTHDAVHGASDTVTLSNINITTELIDGRVWVVINAHVDSMTEEYGNYDFFKITATSGDKFFNGLDFDCYLNITRE